jgi:hypothetical protein
MTLKSFFIIKTEENQMSEISFVVGQKYTAVLSIGSLVVESDLFYRGVCLDREMGSIYFIFQQDNEPNDVHLTPENVIKLFSTRYGNNK